MITWLEPLAFVALAAAAAPVLVHLLVRNRARTVVLPTLRFVAPVRPSAVRLRRPADAPLMLVRVGIVACAALAVARPLFVTDARQERWAQRLARVVIVDTSRGRPANELVDAHRTGADPLRVVESDQIGREIVRAADWLRQVPPSRREVVVLSEFTLGGLDPAVLSSVPRDIGLRLVRVAGTHAAAPPPELVLSPEGPLDQVITLEGERTAVRFSAAPAKSDSVLVILAKSDDAAAVERLRRVLARAGAVVPREDRAVVVRFRGGPALPVTTEDHDPEAAASAVRFVSHPWTSGLSVHAAARGTQLHVDADVDAGSMNAAAVVAAALEAVRDPEVARRHEVQLIDDATLAQWSREASPPGADEWRSSGESDGRWLWLAALILMGVETAIRRQRVAPAEVARAA